MKSDYKELEIYAGATINHAVQLLMKHRNSGDLVYINFNGTKLYSDEIFTVDDGYQKVLGMSVREHEEKLEEVNKEIEKREQEHQRNIPNLIKHYEQKGKEILSEDKWEYWDEIVPIRLNDLYKGMELGNCLSIVKILNEGGTLDEARELLYDQGHSGTSGSLVCAMAEEFADYGRGKVFKDYVMGE